MCVWLCIDSVECVCDGALGVRVRLYGAKGVAKGVCRCVTGGQRCVCAYVCAKCVRTGDGKPHAGIKFARNQ